LMSATTAPVYAAPGYLIFQRNEALLGQAFDPGGRKLSGDPFTIGDPPSFTTMTANPGATVSRNGVLAWVSAGKLDQRLIWVDRNGRQLGTVDIPLDRWNAASLSPDGTRAMAMQDIATGNADLWVIDLKREVANRITYEQGKNFTGAWSPDSKTIYYGSTRGGIRDIYARSADGSGSDRLLYQSSVPFKDPSSCSPDGKWIVMQEIGDENGWNLILVPTDGGEAKPYLVTPFNEQAGIVSPDGKWLVYESDESGSSQAYVQSFPDPGHKQQVTKTGAFYAVWRKGGRELLLIRTDGSIVSVSVTPGAELQFGAPRELFRLPQNSQGWSASPDGERFLLTVPAEQVTPGISVAVNWRSGRQE